MIKVLPGPQRNVHDSREKYLEINDIDLHYPDTPRRNTALRGSSSLRKDVVMREWIFLDTPNTWVFLTYF